MSERNDLDLDAILAEYHREEQKPAPAPQPVGQTRRERAAALEARESRLHRADALLTSEQRAEESTMVYPAKAERTVPAPAPVQPRPQPRPAAPEPSRPAPAQSKRQDAPAPRPKKKPSQGRGFALMLLVLALLAAALFGLVRWTMGAEKAAQPAEPQALRLELGADLERALDESAGSSR